MGEGDYHISDIYQGGYSTFNEPSNRNYSSVFTGYRANIGKLGISTDPRTANILKEVSEKIAPGQKVMELSLIDIGEESPTSAIPKQHYDEVRRLSKLTGVEITVHGPITDASGIRSGEGGGGGFSEEQRKMVERKLFNAIERAHQINPDGHIPVTFHTSMGLPGPAWEVTKEGERTIAMPVVNQDTGQLNMVKEEIRYMPILDEKGEPRKKIYNVNERIEMMNTSEWDNALTQLIVPKEHADRILRETYPLVKDVINDIISGKSKEEDLQPAQRQNLSRLYNAQEELQDIREHLSSLYSKAYKAYDGYKKFEGEKTDKGVGDRGVEYLKQTAKTFNEALKEGGDVMHYSSALQHFMERLRPQALANNELIAPPTYVPSEKYALEKTAESYSNVAFDAYKKYGHGKEKDTTPLVLIENPPAGGGLSRAEDLKNLVKGAREKFVEKATKDLGMSKSDAERHAEKMIGATWDVGHINQLRKFGFSGKDIIKEAEKIAPFVKHVHLSDNFGLNNVELPMGMGNVDFKEVMQKLGKQGEEARKIVEAAHWWQFQQSSPIGVSMEALGSPLYSMKQGPYWNQLPGINGNYFGGYGNFLPQINYETFGGGFSNLPTELGGQRGQTGRSRMGGTPME
ncbi:MAG: hypothetical protein AABX93_02885 [Nanoarchaeota archaeon]